MTLSTSLSIACCCVIAVYLTFADGAPEKVRNGQRQPEKARNGHRQQASTVYPYTKPPNSVNVTACRPDVLGVSNPGFCANYGDLDALCTFLEVSESPTYCAKFIGNCCCYQSLYQGNEVSDIANPRRRIRKRPPHKMRLKERTGP